MTRDNAAGSELPAHLEKMAQDLAGDLAGDLAEMPPIQLTCTLCLSKEGLRPDEAFWAIAGIPHEWGDGVVNHPAMHCEIVELGLAQDGSFRLFYRCSSLVECASQWAPQTMYSEDDWSAWWPGLCEVTSAAAFELHGWFTTTQKAMDVTRVLEQHELDDEAVARARHALLEANNIDPESIASRRNLLRGPEFDAEEIAKLRAPVIAKALADAGLDDAALEAGRLRVYETVGLDDTSMQSRIAQILADEELDNKGVKQRRAELLAQHGLA